MLVQWNKSPQCGNPLFFFVIWISKGQEGKTSEYIKNCLKTQSISRTFSICPESGIAKLGELKDYVVQFHLSCKSVHGPTWW